MMRSRSRSAGAGSVRSARHGTFEGTVSRRKRTISQQAGPPLDCAGENALKPQYLALAQRGRASRTRAVARPRALLRLTRPALARAMADLLKGALSKLSDSGPARSTRVKPRSGPYSKVRCCAAVPSRVRQRLAAVGAADASW